MPAAPKLAGDLNVPDFVSRNASAFSCARDKVWSLTARPLCLARFSALLASPCEKIDAQPLFPANVPSSF